MVKIKNVITAIGNPTLNNELVNKDINVLCGDIFYKEGIIEYLEKNINIDFIILNEDLPGNIKTEELIEKVRNLNKRIRIILITNKQNNNHYNVYRKLDKVNIDDISSIIKNQGKVFNMQEIPINDFFDDETKDGKIITILGTNGIGKSIFSIIFSNSIKDGKVLIIDFDVFNNSLINLLGLSKDEKKPNKNNIGKRDFDIKDFIVKIENNIDYMLSMNLIFNSELQVSCNRIKNIINKLRTKYDYIIIDTSAESLIEYTKEVTKISDEIVFISGANLLEIKKSKKLLDIYEKEWNIPNNKIKIIFNKYTKESLDDGVLRELFRNYEIVGKIRLSNYYDLAINQNNTKRKEIQKEVKNIGKRIVKVKVVKKNRR